MRSHVPCPLACPTCERPAGTARPPCQWWRIHLPNQSDSRPCPKRSAVWAGTCSIRLPRQRVPPVPDVSPMSHVSIVSPVPAVPAVPPVSPVSDFSAISVVRAVPTILALQPFRDGGTMGQPPEPGAEWDRRPPQRKMPVGHHPNGHTYPPRIPSQLLPAVNRLSGGDGELLIKWDSPLPVGAYSSCTSTTPGRVWSFMRV